MTTENDRCYFGGGHFIGKYQSLCSDALTNVRQGEKSGQDTLEEKNFFEKAYTSFIEIEELLQQVRGEVLLHSKTINNTKSAKSKVADSLIIVLKLVLTVGIPIGISYLINKYL